ncbi:GIY-YIG nuclease family protein [Brevundimonas sp.]|uniref:GIY-YIG nuclease family protein n=1 Tax=Brevundimonas sp. TaxID=1871086 RepID=UPI001A218B00|nr:hypothetical protein [Brevundimonas sp.]MBJ7484202.1 hypothetical protein [Brevundimonas sp.]
MTSTYLIQPARAMRDHARMLPETGGVYAMLLDNPEALEPALRRASLKLDPLRLGKRAILYLGATEDSLRTRVKCHLSDDTCISTFRMSLGAVLAEELGLVVWPRPGERYFGFERESELKLSAWVQANVSVAARVSRHAMKIEKALIASRHPALNIKFRNDRQGAEVLMLMRERMRGLPIDRASLN